MSSSRELARVNISRDPIAIDGPAASGKTTVGKLLAERLGRYFLDTGLMYRLAGLKAMEILGKELTEKLLAEGDLSDPLIQGRLEELLKELDIKDFEPLLIPPEGAETSYDYDLSKKLLTPEVSRIASIIATWGELREKLNEYQRELASKYPLVAVGRDSTSVVFKDSPYRFFLDASPEERARRRYKQLISSGIQVRFEDVLNEILERDKRDSSRQVAPLKLSEGVKRIVTDGLTPEEVVHEILEHLKNT